MKSKQMTGQLTLSVIIPVRGKVFESCLRSISQTVLPPHEVIVVADGSDHSIENHTKRFDFKFIEIPVAGGPAAARNLGARHARGDILFFVDADVVIKNDTIHKVIDIFSRDPEVAAVFGSYDDEPKAPNFLSQYRNLLHHHVHQTANEDASTFWAGCGAIRREIFLKFGGFNGKDYRKPAIEDIELGCRLKKAGHKIRLCKSLQVKHLKRWDFISLLKADFFYRALPWTELILRHRYFINDLNLKTGDRISVVLTFSIVIALLLATQSPKILIIAAVLSLLLLKLNMPVYSFFYEKRGLFFALRTIPWHFFYFFYGGLAFTIGCTHHLFMKAASWKQILLGTRKQLSERFVSLRHILGG